MKKKIVFFLLSFIVLASCSAPTATSIKKNVPDGPPPKVIYYHGYAEICNTTWKTSDQKIELQFCSSEKCVHLKINGKDYTLNGKYTTYYDGVFSIETQELEEGSSTNELYTLTLAMRPDSKTQAWYSLLSGSSSIKSEVGTLSLIQ